MGTSKFGDPPSMVSQYATGTVRASPMPEASRVLVVEDDAGVAGGIVRGLRGAGFDVELATDGLEGTRKALERRFDAIVLDLMLPGQNGLAVLEQLKGRESVPILVLTARSELP